MSFVLRGVVHWEQGRWAGTWSAVGAAAATPATFSYAMQRPPVATVAVSQKTDVLVAGVPTSVPLVSSWKGTFAVDIPGSKLHKIVQDQLVLSLSPAPAVPADGASNSLPVEGRGRNQVGSYKFSGELNKDTGELRIERRYVDKSEAPPKAVKPRAPRPQPGATEAGAAAGAPMHPAGDSTGSRRSSGRAIKRFRHEDDAADTFGLAMSSGVSLASVGGDLLAGGAAAIAGVRVGGGRGRGSAAQPATGVAAASGGQSRKQARPGAWAPASVLVRTAGAVAGEVYEGDLLNGVPHGTGTCVYRNGLMYEGQWVAGRETGQGVISDADDCILYQGELLDGAPHGAGTFYFPSGDRFTGHWKDGLFHGRGIFVAASGASHDGEWLDGQRHGSGTATFSDGSVYSGTWRHGQKHGRGELQAANGFRYSGMWANDAMEGRGDALFPDGSSYSGSFREGKRDGRGDFHFPEGQHLSGRWVADAFDSSAPGTLIVPKTFVINDDEWAFPVALGRSDIAKIHEFAGFDHRGD